MLHKAKLLFISRNTLPQLATGLEKRATALQCNNTGPQVETKCCPFYSVFIKYFPKSQKELQLGRNNITYCSMKCTAVINIQRLKIGSFGEQKIDTVYKTITYRCHQRCPAKKSTHITNLLYGIMYVQILDKGMMILIF